MSSSISTLTSISTISSPSVSYQTASECTGNHCEDVTEASSPGDHISPSKTSYRDATQLPRELKDRCQIHLEEQTHVAAINLLNTLLCDGASQPYASTQPALVPPPAQIGVLATLAIHPSHTSRIPDSGHHDISSLSLSYLRNLVAIVGPVNANLRDAFAFRDPSRRARNFERDDPESDEDHVRGKMANVGSVWTRGQDFWKVVGWAFNCSALYPHRWRWWRPWLEFLVDVLEEDCKERERMDEEIHARMGGQGSCEYTHLEQSLLLSYVVPKSMRSSPVKPIMSALFADGSATSLTLFNAVFSKEQRVSSNKSKKRKRDRVDIENDVFGDYDDDSSTGGSQPPTPEKLRRTAKANDQPRWTDSLLMDTIPLRLRLFALLSRLVSKIPKKSTIKLDDLYDKFVDKIRLLPLAAFTKFIAPQCSPLPECVLVLALRFMIPALLPASAPDPDKIDPEEDGRSIDIEMLQHCFLPFAHKATVESNAKLSLVVECMFCILWKNDVAKWSPELEEAVEIGVHARNEKAKPKKGNRLKVEGEQAAREALDASGKRLLGWMDIIRVAGMMKNGSSA